MLQCARRLEWCAAALAVTLLLALRLPFLPPALDNTDSVNFDLGVHDYDPGAFQPHPPGYPVYIFLAKGVHGVLASDAASLGVLSAVLGAISLVPLFALMRTLLRQTGAPAWGASLACLLTLFNPTVWFNSVRPMSDVTAFFVITAAQCLLVAPLLDEDARWPRRRLVWLLGVALAGLSPGVRLQAIWSIGPLLLYGVWRVRAWRSATALIFMAAVAAWVVPMLILSGGPARYLQSLSLLIGGALPGEPIFSRLTLNHAAARVADTLLAPWQEPILGGVILCAAGAGAVVLAASNRRLLALISLLFAPYAIYHYLLQDTTAVRYTIPVIPAVSLLASLAILRASQRLTLLRPLAAVGAAAAAAFVTVPALVAYHSTPAPALQALATLERLPRAQDAIVSGHHVFDRYLTTVKTHEVMLPALGARRTLLKYWKEGGQKPMFFLRDPQRMVLLMFGRDGQQRVGRWAWPRSVRPFMRGERPGAVEVVRLTPPRWLSESGLLVSPEAGPLESVIAEKSLLHVRTSTNRRAFLVSGFLKGKRSGRVSLKVGGRTYPAWHVGERFTVRTIIDPFPGPAAYVPLSLETTEPVAFTDVWLEPDDQPLLRPGDGFSTPERDEEANLFRWIAPQATAIAYLPEPRGRLTIEGSIPVRYYELPVKLALEWNGRPLALAEIDTPLFRIERNVDGSAAHPWGELTFRVSQSFVPHDRQKNGDRRTLSARIHRMALELPTTDPAYRSVRAAGGR
jgi:hypothetical protein